MFDLAGLFFKTWYKEIIIVFLLSYGQYWHVKALEYQNIIIKINENSAIIEATIEQSIKEEDNKKLAQESELQRVRNAKVSDNCEHAMDWMKSQLLNKNN
jgi:hypothetical protein